MGSVAVSAADPHHDPQQASLLALHRAIEAVWRIESARNDDRTNRREDVGLS